jgi:hypothetical protein
MATVTTSRIESAAMSERMQPQRAAGEVAPAGVHETTDVSPGRAAWALAGIVALLALALLVVGLFLGWKGHAGDRQVPRPQIESGPALEADPTASRLQIEAREWAVLTGAASGRSIEGAMQVTADAGWDAPR